MPELAKDTVALLSFLLPGFLVAWVFYALTSHPKPVQAERVIQALIFTLFVKAIVFAEQSALEYIGRWHVVRPWDVNAELLASLVTGLSLGLLAAFLVNKDSLHQFLRDRKISSRSSQPSEWCGVLSKYQLFCVLHFKDDRRMYGWPEVWPSDPEKGHFFIAFPVWVHDTEHVEMLGVEGILVSVSDIKHIEFIQQPEGSPSGNTHTPAPTSTAASS